MYNDGHDHKRNHLQLMQPIGHMTTSLELHWEVTKDMINEWVKQYAYKRALDKRYSCETHRNFAAKVLHKFYREPGSRDDPSWGIYTEFHHLFPSVLPIGKGWTLQKLLRELCVTMAEVKVSDILNERQAKVKAKQESK